MNKEYFIYIIFEKGLDLENINIKSQNIFNLVDYKLNNNIPKNGIKKKKKVVAVIFVTIIYIISKLSFFYFFFIKKTFFFLILFIFPLIHFIL